MPVAKPKIAKTAAARAKSGDFGAKLELFFSSLAKGELTFLQAIVLGSIVIAAGAAGIGAYLLMRSHVVALSPNDTASLKSVFYSGEPWLVECTKGRKASPMVYSAEGALKGVQIGTLDCDATLPSGKTTFDRFKLRAPSYGPVLLAAANTERPQIAPRNALTSTDALVTWGKAVTKAKMYAPTTSAQFDAQCVRKPWCLVVVTATGRLSDAEKRAVQGMAEASRQLRVVKLDASKANLLLDLPAGSLPPPTGSKSTVVLLKELQGEGSTSESSGVGDDEAEGGAAAAGKPVIASHLESGLSDPAGTSASIALALASADATPYGFSRLIKRPSLRPKRVPTKPTSQTYSRHDAKPDAASKTLTDEELKKLRAEREKAIKEAELARRQKMAEEEASAANIVEEVGDDGPGNEDAGAADASAFADEDDGDDSGGGDGDEEVEAVEFD